MTQELAPPPQISVGKRFLALDQLRAFVVVLVVLHHAILAYRTIGTIDHDNYALSTVPIVDAHRWIGFDLIVLLNDGFFMPLMFLLSGLFVWDSLARKKPSQFLRGRLLRLVLPFAVAELTLIPLAYYPSFLQAGGTLGFPEFWAQTVTIGPWPSGPPWFIFLLFVFDAAAALLFILLQRVRLAAVPATPTPARCFAVLLVGTILLYLPPLFAFGPSRWLSYGPVTVQISRLFLYAAYFAAGVAVGAPGVEQIKRLGQGLAHRWTSWVMLLLVTSAVFVGIRSLLAGTSSLAGIGLSGLALATYCAATAFALSALFLRFGDRPGGLRTSLAANSFAIFLLHYPIVTWVQYALLPLAASALVKGMTTFAVALAASWLGAVLLRRIPGIAHAI